MYVLTLICRNETAQPVDEFRERLNTLEPEIPFAQSYPDELQGAFYSAEDAVRASLWAASEYGYWVGLGVGGLKKPRFAAALGAIATTDCSGDALDYSRIAVEQAQTGSPARGVVVQGADRVFSEYATGLARLLYRVAADRTEAENRVINLLTPGVRGQQKAVAQALKISSQAVSKTLVRAGYHEQEAAVPALVELLLGLDQTL